MRFCVSNIGSFIKVQNRLDRFIVIKINFLDCVVQRQVCSVIILALAVQADFAESFRRDFFLCDEIIQRLFVILLPHKYFCDDFADIHDFSAKIGQFVFNEFCRLFIYAKREKIHKFFFAQIGEFFEQPGKQYKGAHSRILVNGDVCFQQLLEV